MHVSSSRFLARKSLKRSFMSVLKNRITRMSVFKSKTIVSLFAGAGGLDLGLKEAGHRIIWANDSDKDSCDTYSRNIGEHIHCEDIKKVASDLIPDADLIVGGFPCQGFSVANRFRSADDKRNELYLEFLRILKAKKPKWFVAENVTGILSLDKGQVFQMVLKDFSDCGYRVNFRTENMADFGVPQTRRRVLILGTRIDLDSSQDLVHPEPTHSKSSTGTLEPWKTMGDALAEFSTQEIKDDLQSQYSLVVRDFVGHRATSLTKPSPTILARGNGQGGVNATPHPSEPRRLSVKESAAMQSFPAWFAFEGKMTSQYRQIGNAVPPEYGKKLGAVLGGLNG
jgi:DNA (cytosine-5)-methyltransferase 1